MEGGALKGLSMAGFAGPEVLVAKAINTHC
jgi:hypothetical protein